MEVCAAVVVHHNRCMIARRSEHKSHGGLWEFPGGKREPDETDQETLVREFREEFGMEIIVTDFIGTYYHKSEHCVLELRCWFAEKITEPEHMSDHSEIQWVESSELSRYDYSPADIPAVEKLTAEGFFQCR